jgi:transcriptional regulator with XRE-family HTH domain
VQLTPDRPAAFNAKGMRAQRERAGLPLWELRDLTGIPRAELQAYESGIRPPRPPRLAVLARALGVKPLALVNRDVIGYGLASLRVTAGLCTQDLVIKADISLALVEGRQSPCRRSRSVRQGHYDALCRDQHPDMRGARAVCKASQAPKGKARRRGGRAPGDRYV